MSSFMKCDTCTTEIKEGRVFISVQLEGPLTVGDDPREKHFDKWECLEVYALRMRKAKA